MMHKHLSWYMFIYHAIWAYITLDDQVSWNIIEHDMCSCVMMYDIRVTHIWRYKCVKYFLFPQAPQGKWSSKVAGGVKEDWWRFFETWTGAWLAQNPTSHKILSKNERSVAGTFSPTIFFHTRLLSSTWTSLQHCWGGASPSFEVSFLFYLFFRKKTRRILASHVPKTFL